MRRPRAASDGSGPRSPTAADGAVAPDALGVQEAPARLRAVIALHDQLLVRVARRRTVKDTLVADTRVAVTQVAMRMQGLVDEVRALDAELHQLLQALIADPARSPRQRAELEEIYRQLEGDVIRPRPRPTPAPTAAGRAQDRSAADPAADDVPFTASRPRPAERGTLRALFRRLAESLHPDKVQDEDERARRTEIMKQITVAYQDGDYARLIEIERAWATTMAAPVDAVDADETARRIAVKERAIAELHTQLAALEREIRALRASSDVRLAREYQRHGGASGRMPDEIAADHELARMRAVRDFVVGFRDGAISFERFRLGPDGPEVADDDEIDDDLFGYPPDDDGAADDDAPVGRGGADRDHPDDGHGGLEAELRAAFADVGPGFDAEFLRVAPPELQRMVADLERMARAEGIDPRDILRAIQAAAAGAGVGPRPRGRRR